MQTLADRCAVHIQVLQEYFASCHLKYGQTADLPVLVGRLEASTGFHAEMASLMRAVLYGEEMLLTRMDLLELLCLAVSGETVEQADPASHRALRQLLVFVNEVLLSVNRQQSTAGGGDGEEFTPGVRADSQPPVPLSAPAVVAADSAAGPAWLTEPALGGVAGLLATDAAWRRSVRQFSGSGLEHGRVAWRRARHPLLLATLWARRRLPRLAWVRRVREEQGSLSRPARWLAFAVVLVLALAIFWPHRSAGRTGARSAAASQLRRDMWRNDLFPSASSGPDLPGLRPSPPPPTALPVTAESLLALRPSQEHGAIALPAATVAGHLSFAPPPVYPTLARLTGVEGDVQLEVVIARGGSVVTMLVLRGHGLLREAAEDAVRRWQFRPFLVNGKPTAVQSTVTVHFALPAAAGPLQAGQP